jgi:tetratricopeptide (TPR) repeat protein
MSFPIREEAKAHLKPGGLMTAWLALYHMGDREVRATLKSFVTVFPYATLWLSNEADIVLVGSFSPIKFDSSMVARMEVPEVRSDLERVGIDDVSDVLACLLMDADQLRKYADGVDVLHTDDNMLLEYYASRMVTEITFPAHLRNFLAEFGPRDFGDLPDAVNEATKTKVNARRIAIQGIIAGSEGDNAAMLDYYDKAYRAAPDDRFVAAQYGNVQADVGQEMLLAGKWDLAIEHFTRALGNLEAFMAWMPHYGLGTAYLEQGEYGLARRESATAARLNPYFPVAFYNLAVACSNQGDTQAAIRNYERVLQLDPDDAGAANGLAWLYALEGENLDEALQLALKATSKVPDADNSDTLANYFDTLGWVYYRAGDIEGAGRALARALELDPDNVEAIFHLATVRVDEGDKAAAGRLLARVMELDPEGELGIKAGEMLNGMGQD